MSVPARWAASFQSEIGPLEPPAEWQEAQYFENRASPVGRAPVDSEDLSLLGFDEPGRSVKQALSFSERETGFFAPSEGLEVADDFPFESL